MAGFIEHRTRYGTTKIEDFLFFIAPLGEICYAAMVHIMTENKGKHHQLKINHKTGAGK